MHAKFNKTGKKGVYEAEQIKELFSSISILAAI